MQTVRELITAVRELHGSDTKAAPHIGVSQVTLTRWRNGDDYPSDDNAIVIATMLKLDAAYVLAIVRHDRAKSEATRKAWRRIAAQFAKAAGIVAITITGAGTPPPASGAQCGGAADRLCIMVNRRRAKWTDVLRRALTPPRFA